MVLSMFVAQMVKDSAETTLFHLLNEEVVVLWFGEAFLRLWLGLHVHIECYTTGILHWSQKSHFLEWGAPSLTSLYLNRTAAPSARAGLPSTSSMGRSWLYLPSHCKAQTSIIRCTHCKCWKIISKENCSSTNEKLWTSRAWRKPNQRMWLLTLVRSMKNDPKLLKVNGYHTKCYSKPWLLSKFCLCNLFHIEVWHFQCKTIWLRHIAK